MTPCRSYHRAQCAHGSSQAPRHSPVLPTASKHIWILNASEWLAAPFEPLVVTVTGFTCSGNDIRITWRTVGGKTNFVQASDSAASGDSNDFTNISASIICPGATSIVTNYVDVGAATNFPSRFYRIRLVPRNEADPERRAGGKRAAKQPKPRSRLGEPSPAALPVSLSLRPRTAVAVGSGRGKRGGCRLGKPEFAGQAGWTVTTAEMSYVAKNMVEVPAAQRAEVEAFLTAIDEHDDVHRVYTAMK